MGMFLHTIDHLLPLLIVLAVIATFIALRIGSPYLRHIAFVANAHDENGINDLAHHLAHETGGKRIHVGRTWEEFVPAAKGIRQLHEDRMAKLS